MTVYNVDFEGKEWILAVVPSSALEKTKENSAKKFIPKNKKKLEKASSKLYKSNFASYEEAVNAGEEFIKDNFNLKSPFKWEMNIEEKTKEKYEKKGKPTVNSKK